MGLRRGRSDKNEELIWITYYYFAYDRINYFGLIYLHENENIFIILVVDKMEYKIESTLYICIWD